MLSQYTSNPAQAILASEPSDIDKFLESIKNVNLSIQNIDLISHDIVPIDDSDRQVVEKKLKGEEPFSSLKESKSFACFIGTALGDALGIFTEGLKINYERRELKGFENVAEVAKDPSYLRSWPGQYTDDTALALCIADSLILKNLDFDGKDLRYRFLLWFYSGYNNGKNNETDKEYKYSVGIGSATYNAFVDFVKNPGERVSSYGKQNDENGNGTIMRIAPIPIAFSNDLKRCIEYAKEQSYTTHNGIEAAECCRLLSFIVWNFLNTDTREGCKSFLVQLGELFRSDCLAVQCLAESKQEDEGNLKLYNPRLNKTIEDRNWNWKNVDYKYSPCRTQKGGLVGIYCMDATAMALHILYHTNSFKEALLKAVNLGGDADSLGAIVGMLAGSIYGYDEDVKRWYLDYVARWDEKKCAIRAYKLLKLSEMTNVTKMDI